MKHPLSFLPSDLRKPFFYVFLALTIFIFGVFRFLDLPLQTSAAPSGIVSFELAGSADAAHSMVESWDENARLFAAFGLGFDYLFMPVYAAALSLGLLLAGAKKVDWYRALTAWMGWGALIAAIFDAVENYSLWNILTGNIDGSFAQIAAICASIKFALLILGLLVAVMGFAVKKKADN
ncbi:MAG: hypothetical protein H6634_04910 [Anaerolineales bacterium]|nr:hypothetical protein [Anaerolineales bacterium]